MPKALSCMYRKNVACCMFLENTAMYQVSEKDQYWPFLLKSIGFGSVGENWYLPIVTMLSVNWCMQFNGCPEIEPWH